VLLARQVPGSDSRLPDNPCHPLDSSGAAANRLVGLSRLIASEDVEKKQQATWMIPGKDSHEGSRIDLALSQLLSWAIFHWLTSDLLGC
jgi:hypothetical protein